MIPGYNGNWEIAGYNSAYVVTKDIKMTDPWLRIYTTAVYGFVPEFLEERLNPASQQSTNVSATTTTKVMFLYYL
jgi:hypothetical protein